MNADGHCASCVFFDDHAGNDSQAVNGAGLCRFNPPISQPGPEAHGLWPVVKGEDWCGQYTALHSRVAPASLSRSAPARVEQ